MSISIKFIEIVHYGTFKTVVMAKKIVDYMFEKLLRGGNEK